MGESPEYSWEDAVDRYLDEKADKRSIDHDKIMLSWSLPYLSGKMLSQIDDDLLESIIKERRIGKVKRTAEGTANSTINRHMEAIQRVLNCAVEWKWIKEYDKVRRLPEPKGRIRFLTKIEAAKLLYCLPPHMRVLAEFSLCTGMRENNVLELEWNQVSIERRVAWIHADQFKQNVSHACPLSERAIEILMAQHGVDKTYVFPYDGVPLTKASNHSWYRGLKLAGLSGQITWHGLRHTWASWHVMNGTPLEVLKELGGWKDIASVMIYAHLSAGHVAQYAGNAKPVS
jgi:integrase